MSAHTRSRTRNRSGSSSAATISLARKLAYENSGSEPSLLRALATHGVLILRAYPAPNYALAAFEHRNLHAFNVRFPDGTMGHFSPGGPPKTWSYAFHEGHNPDVDPLLPGVPPSRIAEVFYESREDSIDPWVNKTLKATKNRSSGSDRRARNVRTRTSGIPTSRQAESIAQRTAIHKGAGGWYVKGTTTNGRFTLHDPRDLSFYEHQEPVSGHMLGGVIDLPTEQAAQKRLAQDLASGRILLKSRLL